ncbi:hypothetical protein MMC29_002421 [Sticta canariensis]|nr:hypothetical protein [Sticta canariensis]
MHPHQDRIRTNIRLLPYPPKLSTTARISQQQPPDLEASQADSDRKLLYAALEKPVLYPSGFSVLRQVLVPHDQNYDKFYAQNEGVQLQVIETMKKLLGIAASGNSRVEYVMGQKNDQAELEPTILICCADEEQRRKVNHYFRTHPWSMAGFLYNVEVDPVVLASGSVDLGSLRGNAVRSHDPVNNQTLCGLACEVFAETDNKDDSTSLNRLTLGGLICVDDRRLYALTTAHSFTKSSKLNNVSSNTTNSGHVLLGQMYQFEYLDHVISLAPEEKGQQAKWAWNWALLQVGQPEYYKPNSFQPQISDTQQVFIESHLTVEQLSDGEVWVCSAGKGPRLAMLYADRTLITIRNLTFEARSIGLAEELAHGDSGSWVVRHGKLCGYIHSRMLNRPWAYMLPIDPVFQEISRVLSPNSNESVSVEVATRAGIERARDTESPILDPGSTVVSALEHSDNKITPANGSAPKSQFSINSSDDKGRSTNSTAVHASNPLDTEIAPASGTVLRFKLPDRKPRDKALSTDSMAVPGSNPSGTKTVSASGSELKDEFTGIPSGDKTVSTDYTAASPFKPSDTPFRLASGSNPAKNEPEISNDTQDVREFSTSYDTDDLHLTSLSICDERQSDRIVIMGKDVIFRLSPYDKFLALNDLVDYAPEKTKQLLQRVTVQGIICQDVVRYLFMRYGGATASIILKDRGHNKFFSAAEFVIQASCFAVAPVYCTYQYTHSLKFRAHILGYEEVLDGLELWNNQLHGLLFQPALHHSVQGVHTRNNLSSSELPLELYRILSLASAPFYTFYPVVGLELPYPKMNFFSTTPQDSVRQLSFFYDPRGVRGDRRIKLRYNVHNKSRPWNSPELVWAPKVQIKLDWESWLGCKIEQSNSSDGGKDRVNDISSLKHMLENSGNTPQLSRTPITFDGNGHHMVLYKNPETHPARALSNMAGFFEDEHKKQVLNPMQVSSSRFIGFAFKLSYSILKLSSTPWVDADWMWENILVTTESDPHVEPEVFIVHELESADDNLTRLLNRAHANSQVLKEPILTRLGFALTELAFRKRFDVSDDVLMHQLAIELSDSGQIAIKEGQIYGDVVKACLTHSYSSGSEIKTINSSLPNFQDAVQEAILGPLHNLWSSMKKARNENPQSNNNVSPKSIFRGGKSREKDTPSFIGQPIEEIVMHDPDYPG